MLLESRARDLETRDQELETRDQELKGREMNGNRLLCPNKKFLDWALYPLHYLSPPPPPSLNPPSRPDALRPNVAKNGMMDREWDANPVLLIQGAMQDNSRDCPLYFHPPLTRAPPPSRPGGGDIWGRSAYSNPYHIPLACHLLVIKSPQNLPLSNVE